MNNEFFEVAKAYLKEVYCLEPGDIDLTPEQCQQSAAAGETPAEYIDYFAVKYDLTKKQDWTVEKATNFMRRFKPLMK